VHYYNEIDDYCVEWLENLIYADVIPQGIVDKRDIRDVRPSDLSGFTSCHFFAGLGGWAYALRLAGWPDDRPVWTGSCPCQPFSAAGKGLGFADERHLWPAWFWHIVQCRPDVVFGEQVDKALDWLDLVSTDLEGEDYSVGSIILPAAGNGAPHGRHRLWWVADAFGERRVGKSVLLREEATGRFSRNILETARSGEASGLALPGCESTRRVLQESRESDGANPGQPSNEFGRSSGGLGIVEDSHATGSTRQREYSGTAADSQGQLLRICGRSGWLGDFWSDADWIYCRDEKYRPVEPGTFPLAHGIPDRVGRLRAYGNAIVPQVAAEVVKAYLDATS
jgi:DNA (cytosine-5)-methyltransferase 1